MSTQSQTTRYHVEVLGGGGWTPILDASTRKAALRQLGRLGTPESVEKFGLAAARVLAMPSGRLIARLPEVGALDSESLCLTDAQCAALAIDAGDAQTVYDIAAAEKAADEKAATASRVAETAKLAKLKRPGFDSRGFKLAVGDTVTIGTTPVQGTVVDPDSQPDGRVVVDTDEGHQRVARVRLQARAGGLPIAPVCADGEVLHVGDRVVALSGRVGTVETVGRYDGQVYVRVDITAGRVIFPAPALAMAAADETGVEDAVEDLVVA